MIFYESSSIGCCQLKKGRSPVGKKVARTIQCRLQETLLSNTFHATKSLEHLSMKRMAIHRINPNRFLHLASALNALR